jgi:predicted HicB family RNase H-like nuclease
MAETRKTEIKIEIHDRTNDRDEAIELERKLIAEFHPSCNMHPPHSVSFAPCFQAGNGPRREPRDTALSLRVKQDVRDAIAEAAIADGRSSSALVERVMSDWLKENGYLE